MIASLSADLLKFYKRNANWILVGSLLGFVVLVLYVTEYLVYKNPPATFRTGSTPTTILVSQTFTQNLIPHLLSGMVSIGAAVVLCLGALTTASEYGWMTVQTILVQRPGRPAVLAGKVIALGLISFGLTLIVFVAAAATSWILTSANGGPVQWPSASDVAQGFGVAWVILYVYSTFGMALGVVLRSPAAAIGGGLTYVFVVELILTEMLGNANGIQEVLKLLPGVAATGVVHIFHYTAAGISQGAALVDGTRGLITLFAYLVAFVAVALVIFQRRDVTA
jgi:ABC-2 type transport system permease protein